MIVLPTYTRYLQQREEKIHQRNFYIVSPTDEQVMGIINLKDYSIHIIGLFFLIVSVISVIMLGSFITTLLTALILAYVFYPLYRVVLKLFPKSKYLFLSGKDIAAFLVTGLVILLILIPSVVLLNTVTKELNVLYVLGQQRIGKGELFGIDCPKDSNLCERVAKSPLFIQFRF